MKKVVNEFTVDIVHCGVIPCYIYLDNGEGTLVPYSVKVRSANPLFDWEAAISLIDPDGVEIEIDGRTLLTSEHCQIEASWDMVDDDIPLRIRVISWEEDMRYEDGCPQLGTLMIEFPDFSFLHSYDFVGKIWADGKPWNLEVKSHCNSEAGLTEFSVTTEDGKTTISGERSEDALGGLIEFPDHSRLECKWEELEGEEQDVLKVTISTPVLGR